MIRNDISFFELVRTQPVHKYNCMRTVSELVRNHTLLKSMILLYDITKAKIEASIHPPHAHAFSN